MAMQITQVLSGTSFDVRCKDITIRVVADQPGYVQFTNAGGEAISNLSNAPYPLEETPVGDGIGFVAEVSGLQAPTGVDETSTTTINATPLDEDRAVAGTALPITLKYYSFDLSPSGSGKVVQTLGNVIVTPADVNTAGSYWKVSMEAHTDDAVPAAIPNVGVKFTLKPTSSILVYDDANPGTAIDPVGPNYYINTGATGVAAIRVVTTAAVRNQAITAAAMMYGVGETRQVDGYFINSDDKSNTDTGWTAPLVKDADGGMINIPEYGATFLLNVSVNGDTDDSSTRYIILNNAAVFPYPYSQDNALPIDYTSLKQDPNPDSNVFTYVRMTSDGNIKVSPSSGYGVEGYYRANLPDSNNKPRLSNLTLNVAPKLGSDNVITLNTIKANTSLRCMLPADFTPPQGYRANDPITVVFKFYMNGYNQNGTERLSHVFNSSIDSTAFLTLPTISVVNNKFHFSNPYVELQYGNAVNWGRQTGSKDLKKVGFEYIISASNHTWYSAWDPAYSWHFISTGNW